MDKEFYNNLQNKNEKTNNIIDLLSAKFPDIPKRYVEQVKIHYANDKRKIQEIEKEITNQAHKLSLMEKLVSQNIDENIIKNSVLLIGPMGTGKSTLSKMISTNLQMPRISLDNREQLKSFYDKRNYFNDFKDFEFYLTCSILTNLTEPSVIDFGAGHSVYENPIMFFEFQKLISKFSNVVYIIPSENKEESIQILNDRLTSRNVSLKELNDNKHFISMPCNEQLATITLYTKNKNPEQTCEELMRKIERNNTEKLTHRQRL